MAVRYIKESELRSNTTTGDENGKVPTSIIDVAKGLSDWLSLHLRVISQHHT